MNRIISFSSESVAYNLLSGDLYLLDYENAELLKLMSNKINKSIIIIKIIDMFHVDKDEAEEYLSNLQSEFRELNLID